MTVIIILTLSILMQFAASVMAFRLIPLTGKRLAWSLIATALMFMAIRRCIPLFHMLSGDTTFRPDLTAELIGLVISLLIVVGISGIAPIFTERKQAEKKSQDMLNFLQTLINTIPSPIFYKDINGIYQDCNKEFEDYVGMKKEEIVGKSAHDLFSKDLADKYQEMDLALLRQPERQIYEYQIMYADGTKHDVVVNKATYQNVDGALAGLVGVMVDITEHKRKEDELKKISELLAETQAITKVGGWEYDVATGRIKWTDEVYRIYGVGREYDPSSVNRALSFYAPEDTAVIKNAFRQAMESGEPYDLELGFIRANGEHIWVRTIGRPFIEDGKVVRIAGNFMDITERKRIEDALRDSEQKYRELSMVDDLTQLYNSRHFYIQLKRETDRSNRYEEPLTLLLLDLDDFKAFNDAYGHVEGDQVLMRLGQVVKRCLRQTDSAYRYGGEEFTILLPMTKSEDAAVTAERIRTEFKKENFSPLSA